MKHTVLSLIIFAALGPASSGQSTPIGISGLVSGPLPAVASGPTITPTSCSGTTSWSYRYAATDATGATNQGSPTTTTSVGCATLSYSAYLTIGTSAVAGSSSCNIYRTAAGGTPNTTGLIGSIPCGGSLNDAGLPAATASVPGSDSSGSLKAVKFIASGGSSAGGDSWVGGAAITSVPASSVTMEAPNPVSSAYAIVLPTAVPTANSLMLFASNNGATVPATTTSWGALTDPSSVTLPTTSTSSFTNGDVVTVSKPASNADFNDSGVTLTSLQGRILSATNGGTVTASTTFFGFITGQMNVSTSTEALREAVLPVSCTIGNLYVTTSSAQPSTGSLVVTINYPPGTQTMVSATVAAGTAAGTASDTTHSFTYTVGTPIDVQAKNNATVASATLANWTMTCQ